MNLDQDAIRVANSRLWKAHPELGRRQLTMTPEDASYRKEWTQYYKEALNKKPPLPTTTPATTLPAPPATATKPVVSCPHPTKAIISDCHDVKNHVQEGDIVLRSTPGADSDFIRKAGKCAYSHAGIVTKNDRGELVVVDAYLGRGASSEPDKNAVAEEPIDDFFCNHGTYKGLVTRPKDCDVAQKAAQWAYQQTKDPDYEFDIFNSWNQDPKQLYCSDFVYQSYQNAGIELISDKIDFLSDENKANTLQAARDYSMSAKLISDRKLEEELRKKASNSEYITPCQVAINSYTNTVMEFEASARNSSSGSSKKTK
jgi:hypothetical protein